MDVAVVVVVVVVAVGVGVVVGSRTQGNARLECMQMPEKLVHALPQWETRTVISAVNM